MIADVSGLSKDKPQRSVLKVYLPAVISDAVPAGVRKRSQPTAARIGIANKEPKGNPIKAMRPVKR